MRRTFLLATSVLFASTVHAEESCRTLFFETVKSGVYLKNHVINRLELEHNGACRIQCFLEPRCVSYNFGKSTCELNDSDHILHPGDVVPAHDTVYEGTPNSCKDNNCSPNSTCLRGFTEKGYKCDCPRGLKGEYCQKGDCFGNPETVGGECCVFPFVYQGTSYQSCTIANSTVPVPWCATVPDADIEQKWGNCKGFVHVNVVSEGASDPGRTGSHGKAKIYVNGVQHSPVRRGHNLAAINADATIYSKAWFDTYGDANAGAKMADYINSIPIGVAVAVATQDSAHNHYAAALLALKSIGATDPVIIGHRTSWLLVGYKGERKPWITQKHSAKGQGPTRAEVIIDLN